MQYDPFRKLDQYPFTWNAIQKLLPEFPVEDACEEYLEQLYGDKHFALEVEAKTLLDKLRQHNDLRGPVMSSIDNNYLRFSYAANIGYGYTAVERIGIDPASAAKYVTRERHKIINVSMVAGMDNPSMLMRLVCGGLTYKQNLKIAHNFWITQQETTCLSHPLLQPKWAMLGINQTVTAFLEICQMQWRLMEAAYDLWPFNVTPPHKCTKMEYIIQRFPAKIEYRVRRLINLLGFPNVGPGELADQFSPLPDVKPTRLYDVFTPFERKQLTTMLDRLFLMEQVNDPPQRIQSYGVDYAQATY